MNGMRAGKYLCGTDLDKTITTTDTDGFEITGTLDRFEHYGGGIQLFILKPGHTGPTYITADTTVNTTDKDTPMSTEPTPTQQAPATPSRGQVDPIVAGYLLATLEAHGQINVEAWNKALALAPRQATR